MFVLQNSSMEQLVADELKAQDIILDVVSRYPELSSKKVVGLEWDGNIISQDLSQAQQITVPQVKENTSL